MKPSPEAVEAARQWIRGPLASEVALTAAYAVDVAPLVEALRAIAQPDELLDANEGAFNIHAARRMQEQARAALRRVSE